MTDAIFVGFEITFINQISQPIIAFRESKDAVKWKEETKDNLLKQRDFVLVPLV